MAGRHPGCTWGPRGEAATGSSRCSTTESATKSSTWRGSSSSSSACTPGRSTPAPASGSRSARRSWSVTEARSGWSPNPARAAPSTSHYEPRRRKDDEHTQRPTHRDPAGRRQPRGRPPGRGGAQGQQGPQQPPPCRGRRGGHEVLAPAGELRDVPLPDLILLDLNLPRKDGREVLEEVKEDPELRLIPVVVLTTSEAERDMVKTYNLHANAYIVKPIDLNRFIEVVEAIENFWFTIVKLPQVDGRESG